MKQISHLAKPSSGHWVGDGFPVRTVLSYDRDSQALSPFLLLDHAGPVRFAPSARQRGVGAHPHRGFETVTIVYAGEVEHRDSTGAGGLIGPGDVQWMTAASGIMHEERHSPAFARTGGDFEMVQLWVNLPARDKLGPPGYQTLRASDIPRVELAAGAGSVRVIAGEFLGQRGPAATHTPINLWDLRLAGGRALLELPEGHTALVVVLRGTVMVNDAAILRQSEHARMERTGRQIALESDHDAVVLVLTGEPIAEPVAARGPFVMNTQAELEQAFTDLRHGGFTRLAAAAPA